MEKGIIWKSGLELTFAVTRSVTRFRLLQGFSYIAIEGLSNQSLLCNIFFLASFTKFQSYAYNIFQVRGRKNECSNDKSLQLAINPRIKSANVRITPYAQGK